MELAKGFATLWGLTFVTCTSTLAMTGGEPILTTSHPESVYITAMTAQCSGTLIAPGFVLTAAHCLEKVEAHPSFVRLISVYSSASKPLNVRRYFIHPSEDLALLELTQPTRITPATLTDPEYSSDTIPKECSVVGYGIPYNPNGKYQENLDGQGIAQKRKGRIKLIGRMDQYFKTKPTAFWARRLLPVSGKNSAVQITHGDSGGPLYCDEQLKGVSIQSLESYWFGGGGRFFKSQSYFLDLSQPRINEWIRVLAEL